MGILRILNWNLNGWTTSRNDEKFDLLARTDWDVATLQELKRSSMTKLGQRFPECQLIAREPREPCPNPGSLFRCGILLRPSVQLIREVVISCDGDLGIPGPEASVPTELLVGAEIRVGARTLTVVSAHPPHSAGDEDWRLIRKLRTYEAISRWLGQRDDVIIGMDANAWLDAQPYGQVTWPASHPQERVMRFFFADPPEHRLRDSLRVWLDEHQQELAAIRRRRPRGPLALTHVRGGNQTVAERFDVILVPPTMSVDSIEHNYEDAVSAGSDHAYVLLHATLD